MQAIVHRVEVGSDGSVTVPPLSGAEGSIVEVIILLPESDAAFDDLAAASRSSMDFWENSIDDEVWNAR